MDSLTTGANMEPKRVRAAAATNLSIGSSRGSRASTLAGVPRASLRMDRSAPRCTERDRGGTPG